MLEISNLNIRYGRSIEAVHDFNLSCKQGQIVSLVGQNGAGKTSIVKAITGAISRRGSIKLYGQELPNKRFAVTDFGIGYVPEGRGIFKTLSVEENVTLGAVKRHNKREVAQHIEELYELFPALKKYWKLNASSLSGGEQQQVSIARALLSQPQLLILDEPSLGLAPIIVDRVFEVIEQLQKTGLTILLIEQNAIRAMEVADHSYIIKPPGSLVASGTSQELMKLTEVQELFGLDCEPEGASEQ